MKSYVIFLATVLGISGCGGGGGSSNTPPTHVDPREAFFPSESGTLAVAVDNELRNIRLQSGATAVSIAVMKNGSVLYEKTVGYQDKAQATPLRADALFRIESIVKPVTAAAARKLAAAGKFSLSDHVFCTGSNAPCVLPSSLLSASTDVRVKDITVQHLIDHTGGFDRQISGDAAYVELEVKEAYALPGLPTRIDNVRYIMARPLDFTPGERYAYSNFGYMLLGLIVEQASGMPYIQYVQNEIMAPLGISVNDFKAGKTLPADHDPREPYYIPTYGDYPSLYHIGTMAPLAEEGFIAENNLAFGSCIATPVAMSRFAQSYKLPGGEPLPSWPTSEGLHQGVSDGAATILRQLPSGVSYAVFMNIAVDQVNFLIFQQRLDIATQLRLN